MVSSSKAIRDAKLEHIKSVMTEIGYPKKIVEKAISKQLMRYALGPKPVSSAEGPVRQ